MPSRLQWLLELQWGRGCSAAETIRDAEAVEWQLADEIWVNETGFRGTDGEIFDTFEIGAVGLGYPVARELSGFGAT